MARKEEDPTLRFYRGEEELIPALLTVGFFCCLGGVFIGMVVIEQQALSDKLCLERGIYCGEMTVVKKSDSNNKVNLFST